MKDSLQVNDEQYKKLYDLYLNQSKEMQKMMEDMQNGGGQPNFDMEAMQKRQKAQQDAIKAILTEEQWKKYDEMQQNMRRRMQAMGGGFGGGFGGH